MKIPSDMLPGTIHESTNFGKLKVVQYRGSYDVDIEFISTGFKTTTQSVCIRNGNIKDLYYPSVCGVGYLGKGAYNSKENGKLSKCYDVWCSMIKRCYSSIYHKNKPTYESCIVDPVWHDFQNFAEWFYDNYKEGLQLDKDIKVKGNKVYSPNTCMFVTPTENSIEAHAKTYKFKSPDGEIFDVYNLNEFCRNHNLLNQHMGKVHLGKRNHHKHWKKA